MNERAAYLGPSIRRLRRRLGLTQSAVAADLGISPSYVALIESNQRPLTATMLLRIARTYRVDIAELAGDGGAALAQRFQAVLREPMFADIDLPALQDVDVATNYPAIAEAFLRLHAAYREEELRLADRAAQPGGGTVDPVTEVRRFLAARRNHFPELDEAGETMFDRLAAAGGLVAHIEASRRLRVLPSAGDGAILCRYDPHHRAIFLDERLDRASRRFQLAQQLVYLEQGGVLDRLVEGAPDLSDDGRRLARRALAGYGAAAILMPYRPFRAATGAARYDVEALARRFGTSFEQVAHRLTTLQRPGEEGIPFFFLRVDQAGNVSKRLDGAGFPFARHGGGCPVWSVHQVFRTPGEVVTEWLELPDGQRFFSIARTVSAGGGAWNLPKVTRAVALCCAADQATRLVYADASRTAAQAERPTPIGIGCSLCHREACVSRSAPPLGRGLLPDDYHRRLAPFGLADG